MKVSLNKVIAGCAVVFALMQLVIPSRTNPVSDPSASLLTVRPGAAAAVAVMNRSCRDCHSNDTVWPWYSRIAPVSWLVVRDVTEGALVVPEDRLDVVDVLAAEEQALGQGGFGRVGHGALRWAGDSDACSQATYDAGGGSG